MEKKINRIPRLILGAGVLLFAGIIYAWTNIKTPFETELGFTSGQLGFNYTLTMCLFCLGGMFSGLLSKKLSSQLRMTASAVLITAGFFIASRASAGNIAPLYIGYGFMTGLGVGIVYNIVISLTSAWFPDKKGLCTGVMMMTFGFSSMLLGKLAVKLFATESVGWEKTYIILGAAVGIVTLVAGFLIRAPKAEEIAPFLPKTTAGAQASDEKTEFTAPEMLKRASFWKLFIFFVLFSAVGGIALSHGKNVLMELGAESATAINIAAWLAIFNGAGRLVSGAAFDKLGIRKTQFFTSAVVIAASVVTLVSLLIGKNSGAALIIGVIGLYLCAFSYGFSPTVSAALCSSFFGRKNFALNFSLLNLVLIPSAFYATIAGIIETNTGSYVLVFVILAACSVIGLIDTVFIKKA